MPTDSTPNHRPSSVSRAVRHHLVLVTTALVLGALAGWLYAASLPATYASTARVLVNPSVGNPFVPTPTAVRQDELTSLETEAEVARSAEVLDAVARDNGSVTLSALQKGLQVTVPPNTQILEISYSASDPGTAQRVTDGVAKTYLANRARRFDEVNTARIDQIESQTLSVVTDLRAATAAAQQGSAAQRSFQAQLATALRNDLVSLRAQRTALETSESPAGAVISPASSAKAVTDLVTAAIPVGGAAIGLVLGLLLALLVDRLRGVVRSAAEVAETGAPVVAVVPRRRWRARLRRQDPTEPFDSTVRRLRTSILGLDPRPDVIAVVPAGTGDSDPAVSEAVAESFARAGHRVVLVRTDAHPPGDGLVVEEGLAQALLYERLNVLELLQPTVEPLLCVLPGGFTPQSREFLSGDRVRAAVAPLVDAGNLVVIQSPGVDSVEGEAILAAATLALVVVTTGRTRQRSVEQLALRAETTRTPFATLVVGPRDAARREYLVDDPDTDTRHVSTSTRTQLPHPHR
jgi:polysaccharide biosynthesis transport protein